VVVLPVLLSNTAWHIPHLGVNCVDHSSSRIGAVAHNSNHGNSISNSHSSSNSSTIPLLHHYRTLPSGHHSSFLLATFQASTAERWATLLENAASPSKATHRELRHPWSISRGAIKRVLHHERAAPTTPLWRRFPQEKKCWRVHSSSTKVLLLFYLIREHRMTL
jgi:hypothetical protein